MELGTESFRVIIYRWCAEFKQGRGSLVDEPREAKLKAATPVKNVT